MQFFGLSITRTKAAVSTATEGLSSLRLGAGGWWPIVREPFTGAWQRNIAWTLEDVLCYAPVQACVTLIASDIGKLRIKLVQQDSDGIWQETSAPAFSPVLRKPNHFQTRIEFIENWVTSILLYGNTYVLKARDGRQAVTAMYVLDPSRVKPLVAPNGEVFYAIQSDPLSQVLSDNVVVPASEIIHDKYTLRYHPLVGRPPLSSCGLAATQGLRVQSNSAQFFANGSRPGGILTSPGILSDEQVKQISTAWEQNFSGDNQGKVAVLGADLKYQELGMNAVDSQLVDQLKWTAENVCTAFHVPPYMIGVGPAPTYNNIEALNQQYYAQCLQTRIESIELLLDEGLGLDKIEGKTYGTEFDLDSLLRMDTATLVKAAAEAIGSGAMSPNEGRKKWLGLGPTAGGEGPYLQMQNYSLAALAKRDAQPDPFATKPVDAPAQAPVSQDTAKRFEAVLRKELMPVRAA